MTNGYKQPDPEQSDNQPQRGASSTTEGRSGSPKL
ncbi:hypothetical protein SGRA_1435 [Saprospira grandis str. Lewin]|uniref:Uncharacterized protein n=1 Tax=Saprospira grandis (strain Lewin) TaxID=984262 RepID=H6L7U9_SAPGL|nr:hypothetical protein SGRA_1435 [Saprospira grandis str. Lewin]